MVQRDSLAPPRVQELKLTSLQRHNNPCSEPFHFWPEGLVRPHCGCRNIFLIALCRGEEKTCRNQKDILVILRKTKKQTDTTRKQKRREHEMVAAERDTAVPLINCWQPWKSSWTFKVCECLRYTQTILPLPIMLCSPADKSRTNFFSQHTIPDTSCILLLLISTTFWESIFPPASAIKPPLKWKATVLPESNDVLARQC